MRTLLLAHLTCAALVALDLAARTVRLQLLARGAGRPITARASLACNLLADAGAALSPMRLAGEPARIAGLRAAGVPVPATLAVIGWELAVAWPTLLAIAALLTSLAAPEWWDTAGPLLAERLAAAAPWLALALGLMALSLLAAPWLRRRVPRALAQGAGHLQASWRGMPWPVLAAAIPLSAVNVLARTALLPALVLALPDPPPSAAAWFGSFLLVYGQLVLPTPAGVGVVELGFLGGAAGELGGGIGLLLAWRWWTSGVPVLGGLAVVAVARARGRARRVSAARTPPPP